MSDPFLGEIKIVSFNFPPRGWAFCNGQLLPINQNQALFAILGTQYGGNGQTTFALPNFQGRVPNHSGPGFVVGQSSGAASHTLISNEMPTHVHLPAAQSSANVSTPIGSIFASTSKLGYTSTGSVAMSPAAVGNAGGNQPHENQPPYQVLNFVIALVGIFPSRN